MSLLDGEKVIWEGRATWRAFAGATVFGVLLIPVVVGVIILLSVEIKKRSLSWKLTTRRVELQRGWLSRHLDTIELWRVRDVEFRQGIWDRIFGVSTILITSQDQRIPQIEIRNLPGNRDVYDALMSGVMDARQQRGVMNLNQ